MNSIVIVGAGAAGLMAAITAAEKNKTSNTEVLLIERNERAGRKLMITGKGRCNVTNNCDVDTLILNTPKNARFLYSAFSKFPPSSVMNFFENCNVPLKTERGNRVFPCSDKAVDIVDALVKRTKVLGIKRINSRAEAINTRNGEIYSITLDNGNTINTNRVILATGGLSYPVTGSTGDGYRIAEKSGHTITDLSPSLVPLECHQGFCSRLSGLSLKNVTLSVFEEGTKKPIYAELGEMLFTHFGISGPLVLSASAYMRKMGKKKYTAFIDLKPALTIEQLDKRILRDFNEQTNKDFANSLDRLLPKSLIPVIIELSGISPHTKVNQISREERTRLTELLKSLRLDITGFRPIEEAIITSGGISVKEINPATMESKLIKGLYFAGEIIDVDAFTGGFNLQIAFSTGYLAGSSV